MCGIAGIINFNGQPVDKADLKLMTDAIKHRGPDGEGFYVYENVGFGHRRLAIIDLTDAGAQPMTRFGCTITYNGEIYNYIEIRQELEKKGIVFSTKTDTEVILAAYHVWGTECVQKFNGMWAFAIHDEAKQEVFFSRDRFGEKPLYYTQQNGRFIFCSEIKGLQQILKQLRPNLLAVAKFIVHEKAEDFQTTFYDQIEKLPAAHNLHINLYTGRQRLINYYRPDENIDGKQQNERDLINTFLSLFRHSVSIRLRSDVPVGTCLSGGIDSSAIASAASPLFRLKNNDVFSAVTACSIDPTNDDRNYASAVAEKLGLNWIPILPEMGEFQQAIQHAILVQEEPVVSSSTIMQYFVMKAAKEAGLKVMLDGQGADELLLGYLPHIAWIIETLPVSERFNAAMQACRNNAMSMGRFLSVYFYHTNLQMKNARQMRRWNHLDEGLKNQLREAHISENEKNTLHSKQTAELTHGSLPMLLRYADKNAMAFSIETRLPFLDPALVEFIMNLPVHILLKDGWSKYLLRKAMQPLLPDQVVWRRKKIGFEAPKKFIEFNDLHWKKIMAQSVLLNRVIPNQKHVTNLADIHKWRLYSVACWESSFLI
ncbi:MAG TPA: asparagine synthase (glutamine-hydrolyzing) [Phnomibacter sp.]|nr:asparagine synthase (glutamine-hydrolyzing) [Phnomibacter sp.]